MPRKVFISYRREDAKWQAREIYRALTRVLPHDNVFMDIDSIGPDEDFVVALERSLDQCDILHRTADTDIERLIKKLGLAQSPPLSSHPHCRWRQNRMQS